MSRIVGPFRVMDLWLPMNQQLTGVLGVTIRAKVGVSLFPIIVFFSVTSVNLLLAA